MVQLIVGNSNIFLQSGNSIIIWSRRDGKRQEIVSPRAEKFDAGTENQVLTFGLDPSSSRLVVCDNDKQIHVWIEVNHEWKHNSCRSLQRRCMSMTFSSNGETVVVGDKSGDVLAYSLNNPEEKGSLLLGHLSMILDLTFSPDNNFVITCDRDEKIRVSHYPNAYNIESFCLGHTEFVSCLCLLPDHDQVLVSGSGDGTLRLWNYQSGDQHQVIDCSEAIGRLNDKQSTHTEPGKATTIVHFIRATKIGGAIYLAVALDGLCTILILTISASLRCECKQIIETVAPITDLQFDSSGKLWAVLMDRIRPLCVYGLDDGGKFACCESSCTAVDKEILASHLVQDLKFLTDLMTTKSRYSLLWKVKVDNVSDYIRRKQDRLNTGKQNQHIPGATPIVPSDESVSDCTTDAGKAHTDCESMNVALEKCNAPIECEPEMKRLKT